MDYFRRPRRGDDTLPTNHQASGISSVRRLWGKRVGFGRRQADRNSNPFVQQVGQRSIASMFSYWFRHIWLDAVTITVVGLVTLAIYLAPLRGSRRFPLSDDPMVNAHLSYPYRGWVISTLGVALISIAMPIAIILLFNVHLRSLWDFTNGFGGTIYAVIIAEAVHVLLKSFITGFRPYFLTVCDPDPVEVALGGEGYGGLYFSPDVCRQPDRMLLKQAMTSFPSGHAAASFAGLGFLFLYLNGKLKPWGNYRPMSWELPFVLAPLAGALLLSCSVLVNADHHASDVVVGGAIGAVSALATYRAVFASTWDWRFNHIALRPREIMAYELGGENAEGVMLHKGTWRARVGRNFETREVGYWRGVAPEEGRGRTEMADRAGMASREQ
ncbi:uncharacterized protein DNG_04065 [Cephalotrichum gorgonifer]|uniref:Phosphatidic acid phosphatase type 2/haloperoxidase domain-containing protein n=1 Tax=Cephalotrichum gorgonifer TaxID=2041049 RepID=A0AAE8SU65_9PEZI|nr:uncharacterized protein DNG_04065 [Cephalotrichum gorgonifer]